MNCPRCHRPLIFTTPYGVRIPNGQVEHLTASTIEVRCQNRHPAGNGRCGGRLMRTLEDIGLPVRVVHAELQTATVQA